MGPDISAVVADEDGYIAEDTNLAVGAVVSKSAPLFVEEELDHLLNSEFAAVAIQRGGQGIVLALCVLGRPLVPTRVVVLPPQNVEHGVVGQPRDVVLAELLEAGALVIGCMVEKVSCGFFDEWQLPSGCTFEIGGTIVSGKPCDTLPCNQAVLRETFQ